MSTSLKQVIRDLNTLMPNSKSSTFETAKKYIKVMKAYGRPREWCCPVNTKCKHDTIRPERCCKRMARAQGKKEILRQLLEK